ncbi:TonB-dependent receptor [Psychrobium sp. 1_MG-2023]|uniref:TonB-dependent receptor n=1 Tax=Psychrobium sp. 1_MG-2023 TaxID=3062624 RepID=UPI000C342D71|nr:TonB-dependent receptor [Psychrobium sp. 1_MG-2023]MDP2559707.1 TonB-dependent receptor [Psychrobium sp. 1_MG-2023]PKF59537.1 ligand-gated channel protein [Alteromonadales bacterium alter-6D02]
MKNVSFSLVALAVSAVFSVPSVANPVSNQEKSKDNVERIIVTGSRVVESIDEVPATVTVVSRQQIENELTVNSELQNILANRVPGLAATTGSSSNSSQTLRGRAPLIMIDGVPQSTPLRNGALGVRSIDAAAIERIEVIKGATSIYGNGAAGGVINYITKQGSAKQTNVELGLATKASLVDVEDSIGYRYDLSIDGSLEDFSYAFVASQEETGVQRDAEGDIMGTLYGLTDNTTKNFFTKLGYQIDSDKLIQLTFNYYDSQTDPDYIDVRSNVNSGTKTYAIKDPENKPKYGAPQGPRGNQNIMLKYADAEIFTNTDLVVDAYKQDIENIFFFSANLSNPEAGLAGGQSFIKSEKEGLRGVFNTSVEFDNADVNFIYGTDILNDVTSQGILDGRIWVPEMDMGNVAFFLQTKSIINDDWVVKLGARHEKIDVSVDDYDTLRLCRGEKCSIPMAVAGGDLDYEATTYNFGLRHIGNEAFSPFFNYSQGADISDLGRLLRSAKVNDINLVHTEASIIDNYELGFSSQLDDLFLTFAAYRSTSELGTTTKEDPVTGIYLPVRAPQKIWGYEATADYHINDELSLSAGYAWVEGKNTEDDVYLGGKQIGAPKFNTTLSYLPSQDSRISVNYLRVFDRKRFDAVDGKYAGTNGPVSGYDLVNLSGHYQLDEWQLYGGIENLFNNDYYTAKAQSYTYSGYNIKGLGRTLKVGVKFKF